MKKNIAILCGGPSSEYEVSLGTAQSILSNIDKDKYTPYIFYISKDSLAQLYKAKTETLDIPTENLKELFVEINKLKDMYMNILAFHGEFGEDGTIQSILEFLKFSYTGCDASSSSLCMDKYRSPLIIDKLLGSDNLIIPTTQLLTLRQFIDEYQYTEPICIKPNTKGSSVGVHMVNNEDELQNTKDTLNKEFSLDTEFVVQPLIDYDIELSCGCLEKSNGEFISLPPIEIIPQGHTFFDYDAKYKKGGSIEITPPEHISKELSDKISQLAVDIHMTLGCNVYSRSDFLIKGDTIYYLETNTLPGMTSTSLLPQEAKAAGISFTDLIDFLIENS